jgi:hypothetical protein
MSALLSCPKFSRCNASICPLDGEWDRRKMLDNEPLCFYLLEHAKEGSKARFEERGLRELYEVIDRVLPEQSSKWGRKADLREGKNFRIKTRKIACLDSQCQPYGD